MNVRKGEWREEKEGTGGEGKREKAKEGKTTLILPALRGTPRKIIKMTADSCRAYYIPNTVNITDLIFVSNSIRRLLLHSF